MPNAPRRRRVESRFSDRDYEAGGDPPASHSGNLFVWTIVILLLVGLAIGCWIGSFYIFGHPEKAFSYSILNKLKKLEPPKRFELTNAPRGEFLKPDQIFERYQNLSPRELNRLNETLIRNYLRNFRLPEDLVPYVVGTYNILDSYQLANTDFFGSGVVALAQAKSDPNVLLEQIFPAEEPSILPLHRTLLTGLDIDLKRENELSAIIHVDKLSDGRIKVTAVSVLYPSYGDAKSSGTFSLDPPQLLNVAAGLPVITEGRQKEADKKYAAFRRRAGLGDPAAESQTRLMRVARPIPVSTPVPAVASALPADPPVLPAIPVNPPSALPPGPSAPEPSPAAAIAAASPSPTATPEAAPSPPAGSWPVYEPGQMPRGRLYNVKDVASKGAVNGGSDRVYLQGSFVVTASGPSRAVLRSQGALGGALGVGGRSSNVRVIVEFPPGATPPAEGSTFSRDARRPFQITRSQEGDDGQLNVYVREVTRP